ncbi:MAG: helix-turn-helix domain-containing protein [Patescibacteria group bacterium]|nr:helix-turn-helix domain-containing protein [Patescibacteria group bacterium]
MREETLGHVLKRYREEAGLKIEQVEKDTKISKRMILALENDDHAILPEDLYAKNLIKSYAEYLSLDYNKLLNLFNKGREINKGANLEKQKVQGETKVYMTPQLFRYVVMGIILLVLLIYLGIQINQIFTPPFLEVDQPPQSLTTTQNFIEVKGETEKEARVFINGKEIFIDPNGGFLATLDLQKGLNTIKISASKKHSSENVIYREILVQ